MRYRALPFEIQALQWTGDNFADVQAFATTHNLRMQFHGAMGVYLARDLEQRYERANVGQWVCKDGRGYAWLEDDANFTRCFVVAPLI